MTRLSSLQYPLLRYFVNQATHVPIHKAQEWDQRPFRSLLIRGWIAFTPTRGFHATEAGRDALDDFLHTDAKRSDPTRPLTRYFDPAAYGLKDPYRKLRVVARGAA